jgi:hypothetical protein
MLQSQFSIDKSPRLAVKSRFFVVQSAFFMDKSLVLSMVAVLGDPLLHGWLAD